MRARKIAWLALCFTVVLLMVPSVALAACYTLYWNIYCYACIPYSLPDLVEHHFVCDGQEYVERYCDYVCSPQP